MNQGTDNPDQASVAHLPDAPPADSDGPTPTRADRPAESGALDAPMPALPSALDEIATTLKRLDERVGRIETQLQLRFPPQRLARAFSAPWPLLPGQISFLVLALTTVAIVVFMRLFQLDQLQNEIYGDIAIVYEYIADIQAGKWPTYFSLSAGPLYHYLIMPIIVLSGPTYFGIKLASVVVSLGTLAATYALARRLIDDRFALLAVFIAGVSSWLLIFSRLGNSQILVPLLTTCALWLVLRIAQDGRTADVVACAVVSALGLYVYPQSFVLAPVIGLTLVCLHWTGLRVR